MTVLSFSCLADDRTIHKKNESAISLHFRKDEVYLRSHMSKWVLLFPHSDLEERKLELVIKVKVFADFAFYFAFDQQLHISNSV